MWQRFVVYVKAWKTHENTPVILHFYIFSRDFINMNKVELTRSVEERSIGIIDEDENGDSQYNPVILFNFKILR